MKRLPPHGIGPSDTNGDVLTTVAGKAAWSAPSGGASTLDELTDVDTTTTAPLDGETLTWDAATGLWVPGPVASQAVLYDAKGDVLIGSAADSPARLAIGSDGQVLTVDSSQPLGVKWAAPTGGGSGGAVTPTVVGSTLAYVGAVNTITVPYPAGIQAGDVLIACVTNGWVPNVPAGWTAIQGFTTGTNICGRVIGKSVVGGDAGGSMTITFSGSFAGEVMIVAVRGVAAIGGNGQTQNGSSGGTGIDVTSPGRVGDLLLYFCGARASNATLTASKGALLARRNADTNAASAVYTETWPSGDPFYGTVSWASNVGGAMYGATVALSG